VNLPAPKKTRTLEKKPDFERSLARLEEVVRRLESPQLSLDDAMKLFEEGRSRSPVSARSNWREAEGRVEILLKKADGKLAAEPFDPERGERIVTSSRRPAVRQFPFSDETPPILRRRSPHRRCRS